MNFGTINFANLDEVARFLHRDLNYNEPFSIVKHIPKHQREWFYNTVEAWQEVRIGWLHLFKIEISDDKKAIRKVPC